MPHFYYHNDCFGDVVKQLLNRVVGVVIKDC